MTTELAVVEVPQTEIADPRALGLSGMPKKVLEEAIIAAKALKDVVSKQEKPIIFNGKQYLTFEDWQTIGRFYGITAKVIDSKYITFDEVKGFEVRACAFHVHSGQEISCAEAMCLNDEKNWSNKPLFQLRSMAQTRACAKALRNVLSWVVKLAGYEPTPAEEMIGDEGRVSAPKRKEKVVPPESPAPYWTSSYNGKNYIFARVSEVLDPESLVNIGMKPTQKNPEVYTALYSERIEDDIKARLELIGGEVVNA